MSEQLLPKLSTVYGSDSVPQTLADLEISNDPAIIELFERDWTQEATVKRTEIFESYLDEHADFLKTVTSLSGSTVQRMLDETGNKLKRDPHGKLWLYIRTIGHPVKMVPDLLDRLEGNTPNFYYLRDKFVIGYPSKEGLLSIQNTGDQDMIVSYMLWSHFVFNAAGLTDDVHD